MSALWALSIPREPSLQREGVARSQLKLARGVTSFLVCFAIGLIIIIVVTVQAIAATSLLS